MRFLLLLIVFFSNLSLADSLITKVDKSVVLVESSIDANRAGYGTGFVVANNGIIATNYHVIYKNVGINLYTVEKGQAPVAHEAKVVWASPELDLAILHSPTINLPPLNLYDGEPEKADQVFAIGFPGSANENVRPDRLESTASQGIVGRFFKSSWFGKGEKFGIVQHSAPINKGNSGGPLIDACGRVVGINTEITLGKIMGDSKNGLFVVQSDGISFASNASELVGALKSQGIKAAVFTEKCNPANLAQPSQLNWLHLSGVIGALLLAGGALFIAIRKPHIVRESYTQYIKRSKPQAAVVPFHEKHSDWALKGNTENGQRLNLRISREKLSQKNLLIGRDSSSCDIVIDDSSVSRKHASLSLLAGRLMIVDVGSTNGTFVDGIKVNNQPVGLRLGQKVVVGKVSLYIEEA